MHTLITEVLAQKHLKQVCEIKELHRPRRAAAANFFGPAARRCRQPKLIGAPPPTQWRRRKVLVSYHPRNLYLINYTQLIIFMKSHPLESALFSYSRTL